MSTVVEKLFTRIAPNGDGKHRKVTIIGAGAVGLACAYSVINQGLASELVMLDVVEDKLRGEVADLQHGLAFAKRTVVRGGSDYALSKDSNVVVVTAGARQREGETRLNLIERNLAIFKGIIPKIVQHSPDCTILVVSNPVDILTYVTARLSGFPAGRVFGSGTSLDSSRFRTLVAEKVGVDSRSVHAAIVGEHGDSSVALWSSLNVGGVRLRDIEPRIGTDQDPENWKELHKQVITAAYEIIKSKGYTNWAIGLTVASILECVLRNEVRVIPVSVPVKGKYGIEQDVYLSLPSIVGLNGVTEVMNIPLAPEEEEKLRESARAISEVQKSLDFTM